MNKMIRNIVKIDEEKCNGCGECVPSCKESAIQIVNGKAKLISEIYCDGLGACLGSCPQDAITIEEREAEEFNKEAVEDFLKKQATSNQQPTADLPCGCPGTMAKSLNKKPAYNSNASTISSQLNNWPIQLKLIPVSAPYLNNSDIVFLADCSAVAYANLHNDFIKNKIIIMGCPKLDDKEFYINKLTEIFKANNINSIEVIMMEVPCCSGLSDIVNQAISNSKSSVKKTDCVISLDGEKIN